MAGKGQGHIQSAPVISAAAPLFRARAIGFDPGFKEWLELRRKRVEEYPRREQAYVPVKEKYDAEMKRWWNEVHNSPEYTARVKAWEEENKQAVEAGKPPLPRPQPPEPRPVAPESPDGGRDLPYMIGNFYHAMVAPLIPYAIRGVTWYQGESNSDNAKQYRALFPILIADWREKWGQGDFPFLFVQLPNLGKPATEPVQNQDNWVGTREAQARALALPNTGMAVTIDVGDPYEVHVKDKRDVGVRLSLVARHIVYGEDLVYTGPSYDSMTIEEKRIRITFNNVGSGLKIGSPPWTPSSKIPPLAAEVKGVAIAGADKKWYWANTRIEGNTLVVWSSQVSAPMAVRYGWANNPLCNLYNKENLPAAPFRTFRTDTWEP
ncbi:MAG: sialate O-acetylesterase [Candidatus Solibacter sp.]